MSTFEITSMGLGIMLLTGALYFPFTCLDISKNKGESLSIVCLFISLGLIGLVSWVGYKANLTMLEFSLTYLVISIIPFILSYFVTNKLYGQLDL